jgi:putative ABC transport system permease protein
MSRLLSEIRFRLRALFRRDAMERDLDAELRFHVERETEKFVAQGIDRSEALRRARLAFGGVERIKDDARDARGVAVLESTMQDLRYSVRGLRGRPAFTAGVVLTLGLGIGANAAIFGVVDRVLFRAPPMFRDQETAHRLYRSRMDDANEMRVDRNFSFPTFLDLRRDLAPAFSEVAAFQTRRLALGDGAESREAGVTVVTANYFTFFDAVPALGRFFTADEDAVPAGAPVVVLSYGYWQAQFGGRDVLGQQLRVDRTLRTIVGVTPAGFVGMSEQGVPSAFIPMSSYAHALRGPGYTTRYSWSWLETLARRRAGVTEEAATQTLKAAFIASWRSMQAQEPGWGSPENARVDAEIAPVQLGRGPQAGTNAKVASWVGGVAMIVLLIACANVANLMLARAVSRRREIAMRLALGVSRARLVRQLLTESLVLAAAGGAVGLMVAKWGGAAIRALFLPPELASAVVTDPRTVVFAAVATIAAAVLTGIVPAVNAGKGDVLSALKAGEREGGDRRTRLRRGLLVFQASLSVLLLVGAGLFVRSLNNARGMRLGYDAGQILMADVNLRGVQLETPQVLDLMRRFVSTAQSAPGVASVTMAASVPFWSNEGRGLWVPGVDSVDRLGRFILQIGTSDYFATMGTRILRGRAFDANDRSGTQPVMVVSEGMAKRIWPSADALGKCIIVSERNAPCVTIVGIAEDTRMRLFVDDREFSYYVPAEQFEPQNATILLARMNGDADAQAGALRRLLQAVLPSPAYVNVVPLTRLVDPNFRAWKFGATMFVAFGALAVTLAAIGLYSLVAYDVAQRTQEISVRVALGAPQSSVVRMVIGRGLALVGGGVAAGLAVAFLLAPKLETLMFKVDPLDPLIFGAVAVVLLIIGLVATAAPAARAARVDPALVLRGD